MSTQQEILLETGTNELELIEFFIREKTQAGPVTSYFGVNVAKVLEVVVAPKGLERSSEGTHPSHLGTMPLRDLILPVVDLSVWLSIEREKSDNELIIVTEFNRVITGFLVSGVTQIHRVSWQEVKPPSRYVSSMGTNCITGTVYLKDRFAMMLDLERALAELRAIDAGEAEPAPALQARERYRAMIADDSTAVRMLLKRNFEQANFDVDILGDGAKAWEFLQGIKGQAAGKNQPVTSILDVVVSDIEMPQMDGYTLTRKIKEDPALKALPVVLFSSIISKGLEHKGEAVKADDQITKPEFGALTERVIKLIEQRRAG